MSGARAPAGAPPHPGAPGDLAAPGHGVRGVVELVDQGAVDHQEGAEAEPGE